MSSEVTTTGAAPGTVVIPEVGSITLATLDQLRASRAQLAADANELAARASELEAQSEQRFADAGAIIVPRDSEANLPDELKPQADRARQLVDQIRGLDSQLQEVADRRHSGVAGVFARIGDRSAAHKVQAERDVASNQLRGLLVAIGRGAAATPIVDAAKAAGEGASLSAAAAQSRAAAAVRSSQVASRDTELRLRETSTKEMGFDALYTAAYLTSQGPPPITSPLELKRGEQALLSMPATLSRNQTRTHYVGGSQGFSFPIGHTGIRYRVGSFHGNPISQQVLTQIDSGSVVVTTQRLAFVGNVKSVVMPLSKVVHVEVYSDGLAVFHEGRENADFLLCGVPKQVVFYINWALDRLNNS